MEIYMKKSNLSLFGLGILMILFAGCSDPVAVTPPEEPNVHSFTVDIKVGGVSQVPMNLGAADPDRSIAGPNSARIKGSNIRNFVQLIAVTEGGELAAFDEVRKMKSDGTEVNIRVNSLPFGKTYYFLLLMGHWEHDGNYNYTKAPPTLLAAGLKKHQVITGDEKITVTMWPIVVDTRFFTTGVYVPVDLRDIEPQITNGQPKWLDLYMADWEVIWTIKRESGSATDGLADLIQAQQIRFPGTSKLLLKSKKTIVRGEGLNDLVVTDKNIETENVITLMLGRYTDGADRDEKTGSVAFNLEYVPFNLRASEGGTNPWNEVDDRSVFDLSGTSEPVWIIRNGLNDLPWNNETNYEAVGNGGTANGNGAIAFKLQEGGSFVIVIPW
jgi:hypothetical protein